MNIGLMFYFQLYSDRPKQPLEIFYHQFITRVDLQEKYARLTDELYQAQKEKHLQGFDNVYAEHERQAKEAYARLMALPDPDEEYADHASA